MVRDPVNAKSQGAGEVRRHQRSPGVVRDSSTRRTIQRRLPAAMLEELADVGIHHRRMLSVIRPKTEAQQAG